jgi:hypothetical protein
MDIESAIFLFINILKTSVANDWEECEISKLVCCLFQSTNILSSKHIHGILKKSNTLSAPVLTAILESKIVDSSITLSWVLELGFNDMMAMLKNCAEEDTYTVLPEFKNNILVI